MALKIILKPGQLTLSDLREAYRRHRPIELDPSAHENIHKAEQVVRNVITQGRTVYGINTGFGLLANTKGIRGGFR